MIFNSVDFAIFFIVVTSLYFALPHKFRWILLLFSSCYFYMAFVPIYIVILAATIVIDYFAGIIIESSTGKKRKLFLVVSIVANVGVLAVFKYYNFFVDNISSVITYSGFHNPLPYLKILLPIGLSFHTFQAMSYTIEVYRDKFKAERNFGLYALYVMFYPQLVAGPIERPQNIIYQFRIKQKFDYSKVVSGLQLMAWGLFKKIVIADRLSILVDAVYNQPTTHNTWGFILATFFFSYQIYCDFSGYTDIARGAARVMGFELLVNFNNPYHAKTISEFWSRWHISLSTWFRDYLYIPLGGNRVAKWRWYLNLFIVFLVSGFWHGAAWTFIIWGALHGFYLIFALLTNDARRSLNKKLGIDKFSFIAVAVTFLLVAFAWIFFRANNIHDALYIARNVLAIPKAIQEHQGLFNQDFGMDRSELAICCYLIIFLELVQNLQNAIDLRARFYSLNSFVRLCIYVCCILVICYYCQTSDRQFIYFQF